MFAKVKQFVVDKAFGLAFMRYDRDSTGQLNKDQLASLINDAFQLLKVPKQVSWIQTAIIIKMFDDDGNDQISKDEAYNAFRSALAKFGGIGGIAKFAGFGKSSAGLHDEKDQYAYIPKDQNQNTELKISGNLNYQPPEDIDQSMLASLPPVGQNLKPEDRNKVNPGQGEHNQQQNTGNQWGQQNTGNQWGQGQQQQGQWGQQQPYTGNQWGQQQNTGNQWGQQQNTGNQWGQGQQNSQWGNQQKQWLSWKTDQAPKNTFQNQGQWGQPNQNQGQTYQGGHHQHHGQQQPNQYNQYNQYNQSKPNQGGFF